MTSYAEKERAHRVAREARIAAWEEYLSLLRDEVRAENALAKR